MKILHTSDWHIGRTLHGASLADAQANYIDFLHQTVVEHEVDVVLISGDLFDRSIPSVESLKLVRNALADLSQHAHIVITPGNHDSALRLGWLSPFLNERIVIRCDVEDVATPVRIESRGQVCRIYPVPYLDPDMTRDVLAPVGTGDRLPRSHHAVLSAALERIGDHLRSDPPRGERVIVMVHAFITGAQESDSERPIEVGGVGDAPASIFDIRDEHGHALIDYVAAGHLHRPQQVASPVPFYYSGSPMAFSFSEARDTKSIVLLDTAAADLAPRLLRTPVYRPLRRVSASLAQIEEGMFADYAQYWLEVTVTDTARPTDLVARVHAVLPHALIIRHEPHDRTVRDAPELAHAHARPLDIAVSFLTDAGGVAPSQEEIELVRSIIEEAS